MSTATLTFFNLALHSLLLSALGWIVVHGCVRDARRRAHAAIMAILLALIAPWAVSVWPLPHREDEVPAQIPVAQGLPLEWRIKVDAAPVQPLNKIPRVDAALAPAWSFDAAARGLLWLWWMGFLVMALRHLWQSWCAMQWRRSLRVPTAQEWRALPAGMEVKALRVFDHEGGPCVAGLLRPVIAVQASAFQSLSADQWRWLLRHEGEHLRSGDVAHAWLLGWARAVAWWNPFVHALIECWAQSREQVCDAVAVEGAAARESYAEFLLNVAAHKHITSPATVPMAQSRPARRLRARLVALMQGTVVRERLGWLYLITATTGWLLGYALIASVGITAQAQDAKPSTEAAATGVPGEMLTRVFPVPPDFQLRLAGPADTAKAGLKANKLTAKQWLERGGVTFPEGAAAVLNPTTSQLIVKHSEAGLQQVERLVSQVSHIPPFVYVTTRLIHGEQWPGIADQMMSAEETKAFWTSHSQKPGIDLMSAPSVTTKIGQRATVEMVKEGFVAVESNPAGVPVTVASKLAGVQVTVESKPARNGRLELTLGASLMMDPSRATPWDLSKPETIDWSRLITVARKVVGEFSAGQSMGFNLPTQPHPTTVLITAEAVKPDGTKAMGFDDKIDLRAGGTGSRVKTLPGSSYEKALKEAEASQEAFDKRKIFISTKVVDVVQTADVQFDLPGLPLLDLNSHIATPIPAESGPKSEPSTPIAPAVPSIVTLQGVFTDPQFQVIIRALSQKKGVTLAMLPNVMVSSGTKAETTFPAVAGKGMLHATPTIGPEGFTIDLELKVEMSEGIVGLPGNRQVTTTVTIWDGQTIVLGGLMKEDEQGKHTRLIFITGKIVTPQEAPKKK